MRFEQIIILFATTAGFSANRKIRPSFPSLPRSKITSGTPSLQQDAILQSIEFIPAAARDRSTGQHSRNIPSSAASASGRKEMIAALRTAGSNRIAVRTICVPRSSAPNTQGPVCVHAAAFMYNPPFHGSDPFLVTRVPYRVNKCHPFRGNETGIGRLLQQGYCIFQQFQDTASFMCRVIHHWFHWIPGDKTVRCKMVERKLVAQISGKSTFIFFENLRAALSGLCRHYLDESESGIESLPPTSNRTEKVAQKNVGQIANFFWKIFYINKIQNKFLLCRKPR